MFFSHKLIDVLYRKYFRIDEIMYLTTNYAPIWTEYQFLTTRTRLASRTMNATCVVCPQLWTCKRNEHWTRNELALRANVVRSGQGPSHFTYIIIMHPNVSTADRSVIEHAFSVPGRHITSTRNHISFSFRKADVEMWYIDPRATIVD